MAKRFDTPSLEIEEGERLTISASVTGGEITWSVRLRCGRLSARGYLTQETINAAAIDVPHKFMESLRQKIDDI